MSKPRIGGRQKGTPNKKTQELMSICEEEGIDPFRALVKMAQLDDFEGMTLEQKISSLKYRFDALKEICQYLYPKRKALEHSGSVENPYMDKSLEELKDLVRKRLEKK